MKSSSAHRSSRYRLSTTLSLLAVALALPAAAHAADTPAADPMPAPQEEAAPAPADDLDIIVTASRRAESSKDVPIAVSVISAEKLDVLNSSGLDIRFLSGRTPSLLIESSFGRTFPRFYIRGLGNTDFDPTSAQPVSVVYDDVALENPMLKSFPVFDLASVEVLRGPQGTLFGRNTPAGVVKLNSVAPSDTFNGYASASWATYNSVNAEAAVGGPIGGGFKFRVSGLLQRRDDWVTNTAPAGLADRKLEGYRDLAGRVQIGYDDSDFSFLLNIHARDLDASPRSFRAGAFRPGSNDFNTGFDIERISLDGLTSQTLNAVGANLKLGYKFGGAGTLHSITAFEKVKVQSTGDIDGGSCYSFIPGCTLGTINVGAFPVNTGGTTKPKEFSQELRFETEDFNGLRGQIGAYYFHQNLTYNEVAYDGAGTLTQNVLHDNKNENFGLFASAEYAATDALTLRAGVRYSKDNKTDLVSGLASFPGKPLPITTKAKDDNVSWDVSANYKIDETVSLYARFATGYLGPVISDRVNFGDFPSTAPKQTTISGEGGIKTQFSDRVRFDLTGYYYRTKDFLVTAVGGTNNSAQPLTIDRVVGYGLEAELNARPIDPLLLTAGLSYNFTEMRDPVQSVAVCGGGCTVTNALNGAGRAILDGNDLPQAPRWIANWTARYGIPLADGSEIFAFTDWAYRSEVNYFLYTAREFRGKSSLEGGLRVGYRMSNGIEVAAFTRNITNQIRAVSAIDFNNLTAMVNEPRIIGGSAKFSF
ncbi:TonB-dependent receptor [Sphingomonas sp. So64.6b]|uniref:TonB-dependent receptor n=1 Tax=Sphingomonas sp. So64.6b TaxID=2997354 RepID=UPI00160366CD|nr:TonB-dependent receptor [Sphingomonas sp. So64.6b]QNA83077.1 TonB-dependent receptor [Sphingomonas sp. So64.6b]